MTVEATIERPTAEPAGMQWPPACQKAQPGMEARIERLTAELERQEMLMHDACRVAEDLRGLSLLFHGVFCDTTLSEDDEFKSKRVAAAYLIVNCLESMAQRLDSTEDHAHASRREALAEGVR